MRWSSVWCFLLFSTAPGWAYSHHAYRSSSDLDGPLFKVAGLTFTVPEKWQSVPPESPARVGRWRIPPTPENEGDAVQAVVFFFGPGAGGTTQQNLDAWVSEVSAPGGAKIVPEIKTRQAGPFKITQETLFGTFQQVVPAPGVPPLEKENYGLLGGVVESPQGTIYWRVTGPAPAITALEPLFAKILDSVKPASAAKP